MLGFILCIKFACSFLIVYYFCVFLISCSFSEIFQKYSSLNYLSHFEYPNLLSVSSSPPSLSSTLSRLSLSLDLCFSPLLSPLPVSQPLECARWFLIMSLSFFFLQNGDSCSPRLWGGKIIFFFQGPQRAMSQKLLWRVYSSMVKAVDSARW